MSHHGDVITQREETPPPPGCLEAPFDSVACMFIECLLGAKQLLSTADVKFMAPAL